MLGYCENPADDKWEAPGIINKTSAKALIERFNTMEKAMQAFAELKNYWGNIAGTLCSRQRERTY